MRKQENNNKSFQKGKKASKKKVEGRKERKACNRVSVKDIHEKFDLVKRKNIIVMK